MPQIKYHKEKNFFFLKKKKFRLLNIKIQSFKIFSNFFKKRKMVICR